MFREVSGADPELPTLGNRSVVLKLLLLTSFFFCLGSVNWELHGSNLPALWVLMTSDVIKLRL